MRTKILIDCHVFDEGFQGTTTYIRGLYNAMINNHDYDYFFAAYDVDNIKQIFGNKPNVFYLKYQSKNKFYRLLKDIPYLIKKNEIDFSHFQYITPLFKTNKQIVTIHDILFIDFPQYFPWSYRFIKGVLFKRGAKSADILLTVSDYSKQRLEKHFKVKKVHVTPNGVEDIFFQSYDKRVIKQNLNERFGLKNYFIYVSRIEPRKNHHTLLKTFVKYKYYTDFQLVFVGDPFIDNTKFSDFYNALEDDVKNKITLIDHVDFETFLSLLRGAELSIYPSFAEGFGIPPLESIAAKIPTISSNKTALADFTFLKDYTFDPSSQENLHGVIQKALNNYPINDFQNFVKTQYNWERSATILSELIKANV